MVTSTSIAVIAACIICFASTVFSQPRQFSYQAEVRSSSGTLVADGEYQVTVRIYESAFGGTALYSEAHNVTTKHGILNIHIGSMVALPASLPLERELYLGLTIGTEEELQPRTKILTVPTAMYAARAGEASRMAVNATGVITSLNELSGSVRIVGDSTITVTQNGNTINLHSITGPGGGVKMLTSPQQTLMIQSPSGPAVLLDVADGAITTAKLANGSVTGSKIAQLGATSGQILTWNGSTWLPGNDLGLALVSVTTPLAGDGTAANPLLIPRASTSASGYLSAVDWTIFNNKLSTVAVAPRFTGDGTTTSPLDLAQQGATNGQALKWNGTTWVPSADLIGMTVVTTDPTLAGDGTTATPLKIAQQGATANQVLKWNGTSWIPANDISGLAMVSVTAPLTGDGTTANPLTIAQANATTSGFLSSADWSIFNNKLSLVAVTARLSGNGTTANPLDIAQQGATSGQALKWNGTIWSPADDIGLATVAVNAPLSGNGISASPLAIAQANSTTNGFLSSADWTTFNNKLSSVAVTARLTGDGTTTNPLDLAQQGATNGQVLKWNGAIWSPADDVGGLTAVATDATLSGDGTAANVLKIAQQGATNGQILKWNGTTWLPASDNGLSTVSVRSPELAGSGTTVDPIVLAQQGATNGQVLKWNGTSWSPTVDNGLATVAVNAPLTGNGTTATPVSMPQANGSTSGYLTSSDWTIFNNKLSTVAVTARLTGNGTTTNPLDIAQQGATNGQTLKWNGSTWIPGDDLTGLSSVSANAPITGNGTTGNPLTMVQANSTTSGFLSSTDWTTFNNKLSTVAVTPRLTGNGTTANPLDIAQQGATNGQTLKWNGSTWVPGDDLTGLTTVAANAPITGNGTAGNPLTLAQANGTTNGFLSSTDWTTFNNKLSAVAVTARLSGNGTIANPLDIAQQGAVNGQVLKWNGTTWTPANDIGGSVQTDATLAGDGSAANLLKIAQQGATNGQTLKWNGSTWLPADDLTGLTTVAANVPITGNGTAGNPLTMTQANGTTNGFLSSTDWTTFNNKLSTVAVTARLTGNGTTANPLDIAQQGATNGQVLEWNGTTWAPANDDGALPIGTVTNSTLRWSGTNWVENTNVLSTAPGQVIVNAGLNLSGTASPLLVNGSAGTTNFVLTSQGAGNTPTWQDASSLITAWRLSGNALTGGAPSSPTEFFGSTNNYDVVFRSNNTERMRILGSGNVGIGLTNPNEARFVAASTLPGGSTHRHSGLFLTTYPAGMSEPGIPVNALESRFTAQNNSTVNLIDGSMVAITSLQGTNVNTTRAFIGVVDVNGSSNATHANVEGVLGRVYISTTASGTKSLTEAKALRSDFWLQSNAVTIQNGFGLYVDAPMFSSGINASTLNNYTGIYLENLNVGVGNRRVIHYDGAGSNLPFVLTDVGRVGIGHTTPSELLDVKGNILLTASSGTAGQLQFQNPAGTSKSTFVAGAQSANINYMLPTFAPPQNGSFMLSSTAGAMSWARDLSWDTTNTRLGINTTTPNTKLDVNGDVAMRENSITLGNGNNNNVSVGNYSFIRITGPTAAFTITGIAGGQNGRVLVLYNDSGQPMTINHLDNTNSNNGNLIRTNTGNAYTTPGGSGYDVVSLIYSAAGSRWIITATY